MLRLPLVLSISVILNLEITTANDVDVSWADVKPLQVSVNPSRPAIIGGDEVKPHSVPYQAGLRINGNAFCGGSLITPNYVLTAGHCGEVIRRVDVILGAHNITDDTEPTRITVAGALTILHDNYSSASLANDLALIKLAQTIDLNSYIQTAKLPSREDAGKNYEGESAKAIGWGLVKDVPNPGVKDLSPVLKAVVVTVSNLTACGEYYNEDDVDYISSTNICTSGYRNKGTCDGDSGSPLVLDETLIGVTSFGTDLCEMCSPSVYTKVADYLDWIERNSDAVIAR